MERKITDLPGILGGLPPGDRALAGRIFDVETATGRLEPPEEMQPWIERSFGSVEAVREQRLVRVTNRITLEGTLFNGLRASRPFDTDADTDLSKEIEATAGDPFCTPDTGTPADTFGRIRGKHAITAANVAKYDAFHGVVVFDDHDPLDLTPEKVADYLDVAMSWCRQAHQEALEARYPFIMWNCLWRAGGSIIHGHAQATVARGAHYPKVERLRRTTASYAAEHGSDYFEDLYRAHKSLGLSIPVEEGIMAFASLTPIKEKEMVVVAARLESEPLGRVVGELLSRYIRNLGVRSFNVAFHLPPFGGTEEDWSRFPGAVVYIVDRGDPGNRTSDIAAMELYAAPVVAADPFAVARGMSR